MTVSSLDTLELVKDPKSAGFTDEQAEAVTRAVKRAQDLDFSDFATKGDLVALRTDIAVLSAKVDGIEAMVSSRIGGIETRLTASRRRPSWRICGPTSSNGLLPSHLVKAR